MIETNGSFVCKNHKNGLSLVKSSFENGKEKLLLIDNSELDKCSFTPSSSSSPIVTSKTMNSKIQQEQQTARVSIEEVRRRQSYIRNKKLRKRPHSVMF